MPDRTYVRDSHGPRAIDRSRSKNSGRKCPEADSSRSSLVRRGVSEGPSRKEAGSRRKTDVPTLDLRVARQPQRVTALGMPVDVSVILRLKKGVTESSHDATCVDTSKLIGYVSLVDEQQRRPLEKSSIATQQYVSNVHALPHETTQKLSDEHYQVLGYMSFLGLVIRQPGDFRIRTSLLRTSSDQSSMATVIVMDSDPVRVGTGRIVR